MKKWRKKCLGCGKEFEFVIGKNDKIYLIKEETKPRLIGGIPFGFMKFHKCSPSRSKRKG